MACPCNGDNDSDAVAALIFTYKCIGRIYHAPTKSRHT
jgi:hypothetical protein